VAEPLGPVSRVRRLGEAIGRAAATLDRRVLLLGSGG
ncbi:MAG: 3-(2,3-dihydroxyphenyl) propionic acid dioxygenase, partial [Modestobacter sp.]|nr:3-(2,3-dihydroxyphenyl) propionic acid dioxygenase [Modestobacter sp.]